MGQQQQTSSSSSAASSSSSSAAAGAAKEEVGEGSLNMAVEQSTDDGAPGSEGQQAGNIRSYGASYAAFLLQDVNAEIEKWKSMWDAGKHRLFTGIVPSPSSPSSSSSSSSSPSSSAAAAGHDFHLCSPDQRGLITAALIGTFRTPVFDANTQREALENFRQDRVRVWERGWEGDVGLDNVYNPSTLRHSSYDHYYSLPGFSLILRRWLQSSPR